MIRILVVDDHEGVRVGLTDVLGAEPDLEVVGAVGDGADAAGAVRALGPDVVLMDVSMPGVDGILATVEVLAAAPAVRVVMLTSFVDADTVTRAHAAGAVGYQLKSADPRELVAAVRTVHGGEPAWCPRASALLG